MQGYRTSRIGTKRALLLVYFGKQGGAVQSDCVVTVDAAFIVSV